jgi:glutathione S-transferase
VEYIRTKYGKGKLVIPSTTPNYPDYLYWLHSARGNHQPGVSASHLIGAAGVDASSPITGFVIRRKDTALRMLDERLSKNTWLAGEESMAADIMTVFSLMTIRLFAPFGLDGKKGILAFWKTVGARDGYKSAIEKGDRGIIPFSGAAPPEPLRFSL